MDGWSRLFACYLNGEIVEWDPIMLRPINRTDLGGGAIHCGRKCPVKDNVFAIGSEDGKVRVARTGQYVELEMASESTGSRILCLDWVCDGTAIICGGMEGRITRIDAETGRVSDAMRLQDRSKKVVWSVRCLADGIFVSGDSSGAVTFWELRNNLPVHFFQTHDADVLCLECDGPGTTVWSAGVDLKIVRYALHEKTGSGRAWVVSGQKKYHSHDINALLYIGGDPDFLLSGGMDSGIVYITPTSGFPDVKPHRLPCYPLKPIAQFERTRRLLLVRYPDGIKVWQLSGKCPQHDTAGGDLAEREKLILHFRPSRNSNLCAASISSDSEWIAVSDTGRTDIYRFSLDRALVSDKKCLVRAKFLHKAELPPGLQLVFLGKDKLVIGTFGARLCVVDLKTGSQSPVNSLLEPLSGREDSTVVSLAASHDGLWFACGFSNNIICIYSVQSAQLHLQLDSFDSLHTSIAFRPGCHELVVTLISNEFYIYDFVKEGFTRWSNENSASLPRRWLDRSECIMGSSSSMRNHDLLVLYGPGFSCFINMKKSVSAGGMATFTSGAPSKRKAGSPDSTSDHQPCMKMEHRYAPLMALDFLSDAELAVVECPVLKFLNALPPPFTKRAFGT